jgi:hypothetical protein
MSTITITGVQAILNNQDTIFMKQGRGTKIHLSAGSCRDNNLLCGVTYARNGSRASYLMAYTVDQVDTKDMCKNCLVIVHHAVTPIV